LVFGLEAGTEKGVLDDLRLACAVAGFGKLLRGSAEKESLTYAGVLGIAQASSAQNP
jgi:hypothetical protein